MCFNSDLRIVHEERDPTETFTGPPALAYSY